MKEIKIGSQIWTAKNMAVTVDRDGNELVSGKDYFYPGNDEKNVEKYGLLYTWNAAMRIAPKGWHLPTDDEWTELENYCSSRYSIGKYIAKVLSSIVGWHYSDASYAIGNNQSINNKSGFNGLPVGSYYDSCFTYVGFIAYFWSATSYSDDYAYYRSLNYNYKYVYRNTANKYNGFSVRLVKGELPLG